MLEGTAIPNVPLGGEFAASALPATHATLFVAEVGGARRPILGEAVVVGGVGAWVAQPYTQWLSATVPLSSDLTLTSGEKLLFAGYAVPAQPMRPTEGLTDDRFAICVDPAARRFAVAGFAWARVRAIKPWHRFARRCLSQPGDGSTENDASVGCLDSCGWGPAEILGYVSTVQGVAISTGGAPPSASSPSIYWALIRF